MPHLFPCIEPDQVPIPLSVLTLANTGVAAQTKNQAGVTGNACCLVVQSGKLSTRICIAFGLFPVHWSGVGYCPLVAVGPGCSYNINAVNGQPVSKETPKEKRIALHNQCHHKRTYNVSAVLVLKAFLHLIIH